MNNQKPLIHFFHDYKTLPFPRALLQTKALEIAQQNTILMRKEVNCILCSDYTIKKLNTLYRKKNKPTDVLSFPLECTDFLGEIYISLQRSVVQSRRFHTTYNKEIVRLFIHGLLHLLGYDHIQSKDAKIMESLELHYSKNNQKK